MVVINHNRCTAIVVARKECGTFLLVPMSAGSLSLIELPKRVFEREWRALDYPTAIAIERFLTHAKTHGATNAAMRGLNQVSHIHSTKQGQLF